jgi:two-component system OmpR family response regulator
MTTIALLEDEADLREEVADFLGSRGHRVLQAGSLAEFLPLASAARVAVLDVMLPDGSGFDALRQVRAFSPRTGVIMLTALGAASDRMAGLRQGADHYLVKPFGLLELDAVIEALLRRVGREWVFDAARATLLDPAGQIIELTDQEAVVLGLLARAPDHVVTRRQIVEALGQVWTHYDLRRLDTLVSRLRARWQRISGCELPLRTLHREGYEFTAMLEVG